MATMTNEQLDSHVNNLMITFHGDLSDLYSAVGALNLGKVYGWRVLKIIINPITYRKYEKILCLSFKDVLSETTDYSYRSYGYKMAMEIGKYWDIAQRRFSMDSKIRTMTA